jgi:hypothetical protein
MGSGLAVVGFPVFDGLFPRSVRRCLAECRDAGVAPDRRRRVAR